MSFCPHCPWAVGPESARSPKKNCENWPSRPWTICGKLDLTELEGHFGRYGVRLHELALGIDNNQVIPNRPTQSISAEDLGARCIADQDRANDSSPRGEDLDRVAK